MAATQHNTSIAPVGPLTRRAAGPRHGFGAYYGASRRPAARSLRQDQGEPDRIKRAHGAPLVSDASPS